MLKACDKRLKFKGVERADEQACDSAIFLYISIYLALFHLNGLLVISNVLKGWDVSFKMLLKND